MILEIMTLIYCAEQNDSEERRNLGPFSKLGNLPDQAPSPVHSEDSARTIKQVNCWSFNL